MPQVRIQEINYRQIQQPHDHQDDLC